MRKLSELPDLIKTWLTFDKIIIPIAVVGVIFAVLIVGALLVKTDVEDALDAFFQGTFGTSFGNTTVFLRTAPLLLTGIGVAVAFRARLINIGAEGQLYIGALVATWGGIVLDLPSIVFIPVLMVLAFLAGGAWASVAAVLKAKYQINEIIITFMMNFIAIFLASWALLNPLKGSSPGLAQSADIAQNAMLPVFGDTRIHLGIVVGILACIIIYYFFKKTKKGFELRMVGSNPDAARSSGVSIFRSMFLAMMISGGLSGLAGMIEVTGIHHHLIDGISPGYGYTGIVIALVPNLHPLGVIASAFLFGITFAGADAAHRIAGLPIGMVFVIQGIVMFVVISLQWKRFKFWQK